ncbi:hypothetical protein D5366_04730 [Neokomagataea tanensis]|uniref:Uncharacterized protein n=1 Tax=Neokomagataea tanensis TaxID=661191 RepID=A0A4Y6V8F3_9PROT|nr:MULTISPECIES: hypothetical protein [Neokomagataea]QDH24645.1 hypothetical protein D5366_04730 [Neokomagataea tanensis]
MTFNLSVLASTILMILGAGVLLYRAGKRGQQAQSAQQDIFLVQQQNAALRSMAQQRVDAPRSRDELLAILDRGEA